MSTMTVNVDVDVDLDDLKDAGYHHEDDCPAEPILALQVDTARHALADWHDMTHGVTLWSGCNRGPCNVLPTEFREP